MHLNLEIEAPRQWLDALVKDVDTAEAKAAARLLLEEEQAATADLERKASAATGCYRLLPHPRLRLIWSTVPPTAFVTNLHVQATVVPNVRQLVNIVFGTTSSNYAIWRDLMLMP
jgi:hypothetical protein